jgi:hypothetical protein
MSRTGLGGRTRKAASSVTATCEGCNPPSSRTQRRWLDLSREEGLKNRWRRLNEADDGASIENRIG